VEVHADRRAERLPALPLARGRDFGQRVVQGRSFTPTAAPRADEARGRRQPRDGVQRAGAPVPQYVLKSAFDDVIATPAWAKAAIEAVVASAAASGSALSKVFPLMRLPLSIDCDGTVSGEPERV
jgi:uncharacterized protein YbjT (DUF2867 family)